MEEDQTVNFLPSMEEELQNPEDLDSEINIKRQHQPKMEEDPTKLEETNSLPNSKID